MTDLLRNEPVVIRTVVALLSLAVSFGLPIDDGQIEGVVEAVGSIIALLAVLSARQVVTPVAKLNATLDLENEY